MGDPKVQTNFYTQDAKGDTVTILKSAGVNAVRSGMVLYRI